MRRQQALYSVRDLAGQSEGARFTKPCFSKKRKAQVSMPDTLPWNKRIRYERLKRGWSQEMAAERLLVEPRTLRDWEAGRHAPGYEGRQMLSQVYGQSIEELGLLDPKRPMK